MPNRRQFIAGMLATGLAPTSSWGDAGAPAYLSAAAHSDGSYALCGISDAGDVIFEIPLPTRGHAAAAHPTRPEAVAFARRPGTYAIVINCATGAQQAVLDAPIGRHFYGHGVFSQDGAWLFTTENDYAAGRGRVGVWDAANGYARAGEYDSGGTGPHDIKRLPGSDILVVANGGIDTHPESGRAKLNIPTMKPNLTYIRAGELLETAELSPEWHKNSIRHLAISREGQVAFGMQWQGDQPEPALVGVHRMGEGIQLLTAPDNALRNMQAYVGSIAYSSDEREIVVTSPRGGIAQRYNAQSRQLTAEISLTDVCGAATAPQGVLVSTGTGALVHLQGEQMVTLRGGGRQWDNHLIGLKLDTAKA
ncbi:DUF1513 domain-containing protein [Loktanella agnita]|uniref:DUF1513 domain-containing protein n=1 Tax=Loktanella agnita TaxID=287097 RepID=UPI003986B647